MKHIKRGRAPSMMSGVVGIFMIGFGILWTVAASRMSGIFALFGVLWTCIAIVNTIYSFKNAVGKNRYSEYDITSSSEEPDPFMRNFPSDNRQDYGYSNGESNFCPYCGSRVEDGYRFCNKCGKELP